MGQKCQIDVKLYMCNYMVSDVEMKSFQHCISRWMAGNLMMLTENFFNTLSMTNADLVNRTLNSQHDIYDIAWRLYIYTVELQWLQHLWDHES